MRYWLMKSEPFKYGWDDLVFTHISARVPGPEHHFLINPYGMMFEEITASSLVKIDLQGEKVEESPYPVNPAGFTIHSAIHQAREDAHCVMHTHTTAGMAVASKAAGLDWNNFYAAQIYRQASYHDLEGITIELDEQKRLLASMGDNRLMILRNHGLLAWGETISAARVRMWPLNRACEIQIAAEGIPGPSIPLSEEVRQQCAEASVQFDRGYGGGRDVFDALRRQIDRKDPSYRT